MTAVPRHMMTTQGAPWVALGLITLIAVSTGCAETPVIDLRLVKEASLILEGDLRVRFRRVSDNAVIHEVGATGNQVDMAPSRAGLDFLREGEELFVTLRGASPRCPKPVVGRSLAFRHRRESYTIPIAIGCADQFNRTLAAPTGPRLGHTVTALGDGGAVIAGGAPRIDLSDDLPAPLGETLAVERYDLATGRYETLGPSALGQPRIFAPALHNVRGEVALFGGIVATDPANPRDRICADDVQVVYPEPRTVDLTTARCFSGAAETQSGFLVMGGNVNTFEPAVELHGKRLIQPPAPSTGPSDVWVYPQVVGLGGAVILAGASLQTSDAPLALGIEDCGDGPCIRPQPLGEIPTNWFPGFGDVLAVVECLANPERQSLFVVGGAFVEPPTPPSEEPGIVPTDRIWCSAVELDQPLRFVDTQVVLPSGRHSHSLFAVGAPGPRTTLVGVGGVTTGDDAVRLVVDGCNCLVEQVEESSLGVASIFLFGSGALLADQSLLVVGGGEPDPVEPTVFRGFDFSQVYFPDLEGE
ncbi:MAG: kelch repeat-containing protein [Myxococcota bacterium]